MSLSCVFFSHKPARMDGYSRVQFEPFKNPVDFCDRCGTLFIIPTRMNLTAEADIAAYETQTGLEKYSLRG